MNWRIKMKSKFVCLFLLGCVVGQASGAPKLLTNFIRGAVIGAAAAAFWARVSRSVEVPVFSDRQSEPVVDFDTPEELFDHVQVLISTGNFDEARNVVLNSSHAASVREELLSIIDSAGNFEFVADPAQSLAVASSSRVDPDGISRTWIDRMRNAGDPAAILANFIQAVRRGQFVGFSDAQLIGIFAKLANEAEQKILQEVQEGHERLAQDKLDGVVRLHSVLVSENDSTYAPRVFALMHNAEYVWVEFQAQQSARQLEDLHSAFEVLMAQVETTEDIISVHLFDELRSKINVDAVILSDAQRENLTQQLDRLIAQALSDNVNLRKEKVDQLFNKTMTCYKNYTQRLDGILSAEVDCADECSCVLAALKQVVNVTPEDHTYHERALYYLNFLTRPRL